MASLIEPLVCAGIGLYSMWTGLLERARNLCVLFLGLGAGLFAVALPGAGMELFLATNLAALYIWFPPRLLNRRRTCIILISLEYFALTAYVLLEPIPVFDATTVEVAGWVARIFLPIDLLLTIAALLQAKQAQHAALRRANERAVAAARTKSRILNSVAHELRSPLTATLGLFSELRESGPNPKLSEQAEVQVERVLRCATDLLDFARLEGESPTVRTETRVLEPMALVQRLLNRKGWESAIEVEGEGVDSRTLRFDATGAERALEHLLENAQVHGAPPIRVEVAWVEEREVVFDVKDGGPGVPESREEEIFHAFETLGQGQDDATAGTGVGLAVSRAISRSAGGDLSYIREAKGACFRLRLPAELDSLERSLPRAPLGLKVLVVEDDAINRLIVGGHLTRLGCEVEIAEDGIEGVERCEHQSFDLVLMDVRMPRMDGLAATRVIKKSLGAPPIVALTANALAGDAERCFEAGMDAFMAKPFKKNRLLEILGELGVAGRD